MEVKSLMLENVLYLALVCSETYALHAVVGALLLK